MKNKVIKMFKTKLWVSFYYMINRKITSGPENGFSNLVFEGSETSNMDSIETIRICERKIRELIAVDMKLPVEIISVCIINWKRLER